LAQKYWQKGVRNNVDEIDPTGILKSFFLMNIFFHFGISNHIPGAM